MNVLYKRLLAVFVLIFSSVIVFNAAIDIRHNDEKIVPPFINKDVSWVDSVFNSMSNDEKITQLFMVAAYSNRNKAHVDEISKLIKDYKIGGLIFFQGGPARQAILTNYYQSISKTPLFISIDGEWGLSMRLDSTMTFPRQMMLGALDNDSLIYEMGKEIACECIRMGIQINFAPVIDINNNYLNPVIGRRSFGEDKEKIVRKACNYMNGLQDYNVMAVGKHFPGHGNTDADSHLSLPVICSSYEQLDSTEFYPFKQLISKGVTGIMVAHLSVPALDSTTNLASTLSPLIVKDLLKGKLGFKGLVFTDALNMKGVSKYFKSGDLEVRALKAGNDILVFPEDIPLALKQIKQAIDSGEISMDEINEKCKKVLAAKYWAGLNKLQPIDLTNLYEDLNTPTAMLLRRKLVEGSLTLVKNENNLVPFYRLDTISFASLAIGASSQNTFQDYLSLYANIKHFTIKSNEKIKNIDTIINSLAKYNTIIISIHNSNSDALKDFGITEQTINIINILSEKSNIILDIFGTPYCLSKLNNISRIKAILLSYDDYELTKQLSAQLLFGGIPSKGILPVTVSNDFKLGYGIILKNKIRLKYSVPEELGIDSKYLNKIDSLVSYAIKKKAFPGCQIVVAKDGIVFYRKSFGYYTYEKVNKVTNDDIYDLASLTKIFSSTISLMKLCDENKFEITNKLSDYLPELKTTNKKNIYIEDVLTHQARLAPWIPFYIKTIKNDSIRKYYYNKEYTSLYSVKIADSLFLRNDYKENIYKQINESELLLKKEYKYSDLGFYYMQQIIEKNSNTSLDNFTQNNFYKQLGASNLGYNPLERFPIYMIIPTEFDRTFRKQIVNGYVHDQGAALLGGVGGHAGLFSNANDLTKVLQMLIQKGEYGGRKYISKETVDLFTSCRFCPANRRGLGFDKPENNHKLASPACKCVSPKSFGHSGFTGTFAWADPENNLTYIFLSNRVYPDADNNLIISLNTRTKIQEVIYNSINK